MTPATDNFNRASGAVGANWTIRTLAETGSLANVEGGDGTLFYEDVANDLVRILLIGLDWGGWTTPAGTSDELYRYPTCGITKV
jgi:hypothetical protein